MNLPHPYHNSSVIFYSTLLASSFEHWIKRPLYTSNTDLAQALYEAPFALVSHGTQPDPIFCYANLTAQKLWGYDWEEFVTLPSRLSAEPAAHEERQQLLERAALIGYIDNYRGIRIARSGTRFEINKTILWNVVDAHGIIHGQAAMFEHWVTIA